MVRTNTNFWIATIALSFTLAACQKTSMRSTPASTQGKGSYPAGGGGFPVAGGGGGGGAVIVGPPVGPVGPGAGPGAFGPPGINDPVYTGGGNGGGYTPGAGGNPGPATPPPNWPRQPGYEGMDPNVNTNPPGSPVPGQVIGSPTLTPNPPVPTPSQPAQVSVIPGSSTQPAPAPVPTPVPTVPPAIPAPTQQTPGPQTPVVSQPVPQQPTPRVTQNPPTTTSPTPLPAATGVGGNGVAGNGNSNVGVGVGGAGNGLNLRPQSGGIAGGEAGTAFTGGRGRGTQQPRAQASPRPAAPVTQSPAATTTCDEGRSCVGPLPKDGSCKPQSITETKRQKKLDILFVVDTSASLRGGIGKTRKTENDELVKVAREMESFVAKLDRGTDYRIGVLLAHGKNSPRFGKLFTVGGQDTAVLDSKRLSDQAMWKALERKMVNIPIDRTDAQGEAMLHALYQVITNQAARTQIEDQGRGLFRKDANLAVLFVSDENDVCVKGKIPDKYEERYREQVCSKAANGKPLTHVEVAEALHAFEKQYNSKVIVNGIVYEGENLPQGAEDENERGIGMIDLIQQMSSGITVDLAEAIAERTATQGRSTHAFERMMSRLGEHTQFQIDYETNLRCITSDHPSSIDPKSIELVVYTESKRQVFRLSALCEKGKPCQHGLGSVQAEVKGSTQHPYLDVKVDNPERLAYFLESHQVTKGSYQIKYRTLGGYDTTSGKRIGTGRPD